MNSNDQLSKSISGKKIEKLIEFYANYIQILHKITVNLSNVASLQVRKFMMKIERQMQYRM
ncbi:TPA: hypothetical protein JD275_01615 [Proteus mirabilis]|uniref:Uncharacterized protein n=1 Tax=Proteus mirabilis (strain HI4320) TaxID=529507 RepID=B4F1B6_PROMH|nr:hypothetical protein PMI2106 [Proteus mirabilis HI4320]HAU5547668.1 hypothetical protein [Proteus mirabilis]